MYGSEEAGQQFAKDHGANYQVAQLQRNRRGRRISVMHAFLPILATIVLEFRIFYFRTKWKINISSSEFCEKYRPIKTRRSERVPLQIVSLKTPN